MNKISIFCIGFFILSACSHKLKETIGVSTPGPNEYRVKKNMPLEIPPHYNLGNKEANKIDVPVAREKSNKNQDSKLSAPEKALLQDLK